jgi:hypothetical protein
MEGATAFSIDTAQPPQAPAGIHIAGISLTSDIISPP